MINALLSPAARAIITEAQAYRLQPDDVVIAKQTYKNPGGEIITLARCLNEPTIKVSVDGDAYLWATALWGVQNTMAGNMASAPTESEIISAVVLPPQRISAAVLAVQAIADMMDWSD